MKRITTLLLVTALCLAAACGLAASWPEGRSASQPYAGVPAVNLTQTMGYMIFYPSARMPAERFCDSLAIYFPREDLTYGTGTLRLMDGSDVVLTIDCADERLVEIRAMTEEELGSLLWGGGMVVSFHLPISLELGKTYTVELDQGAVAVSRSRVVSPPVHSQWKPELEGDFGVSRLYYMGGDYVDENGVLQNAPLRDWPRTGDNLFLTVVLGGEAVRAVIQDDAGALQLSQTEFTETTEIAGTVEGNIGAWRVLFYDAAGNEIGDVELNPVGEEAP